MKSAVSCSSPRLADAAGTSTERLRVPRRAVFLEKLLHSGLVLGGGRLAEGVGLVWRGTPPTCSPHGHEGLLLHEPVRRRALFPWKGARGLVAHGLSRVF